MKHSIDVQNSGPFAASMAEAVETCVHCGFCLPACPTYNELGQEADSPRGRIFLMKQVLEEELEAEDVADHVDQCLGCLACETACPSGVKYRDLISPYRATVQKKRTFWERVRDRLTALTLPFPTRFRWAMRLGKWTKWLSFLLPRALKPMTEMIPDSVPSAVRLAEENLPDPAKYPEPSGQAILVAGCAQQVLAPQINANTIRLLNYCGVAVNVPRNQSCCGALSWHNGNGAQAKKLASKNFARFGEDCDWIVTNAAGCGSGMKEYEVMFQGTNDEQAAALVAGKTIDVSVLLWQLGLPERIAEEQTDLGKLKVAYHDACHLAHGQNVRLEPRKLLKSIPGIEFCELRGSEFCCGSAGTYNIEQPKIAADLGRQKAAAVMATQADYLVTGNIGCIVQIQNHLRDQGSKIQVMHLVDFLAEKVLGRSALG